MALQLRARKRNINKWMLTVMSIFAFVAAPFYGVMASRVANALPDTTTNLQPCTSTNTIKTTDLSTWNLSETRTTGHNELVANGLHVWTEGNTSTDKAAGYYPASFKLADLGAGFGLSATGSDPTPPSLQLTVDLDGNGTPEGNLVAEPAAYGANTLWLSSNWTNIDLSNAPTTVNGGGTGKGGTVSAWLAAFPNAKVVAVGYSLGSGVKGDFVINQLTANCVNYTFAKPAPGAPANLNIVRNGTNVTSGSTVNSSFMTGNTVLNFDAVPGADAYITQVTYPGGSDQVWNGYHNTWLVTNGAPGQGEFGAHGDGTYTYTVKARDASTGLWSDWSSPVSLTYDTTGPTVMVTNPSTSSVSNAQDLVLSGTASDPAGVLDVYVRAYDAAVYPTRVFMGTATLNGSNWTLNVPAGTFQNGHMIQLQVFGRDTLHNQSEKDVTFTVDSTAPQISVDPGYVGNEALKLYSNVSFKLHDNVSVTKYALNQGTTSEVVVPVSVNQWSDANFQNIVGHLNEGTNTITVYDVAGNSTTYTFTYDGIAPVITTNINDGDVLRSSESLTMTLDGEQHPSTYNVRVLDANGQPIQVNGQNLGGYVTNDGSNTYTYVFDTTQVSDGTYKIQFSAKDAAGNAATTVYRTITVDNTPPTITIKAGYVGDLSKKVFSNVSFSLYDAHKVAKYVINGHTSNFSINNYSDANFQNIKAYLVQGQNTLTLYDVAGNSSSYTFTYDSVAPVVAITSPRAGTLHGTVTISGTVSDSNPDHYYLVVKDSNGNVVAGPGTVNQAQVADWAWNTKSVSDGTYMIDLEARDAAGNKDVSSVATVTVTVDNTAPVVTITSAARNSDGSYTITGTSDDTAPVDVLVNLQPYTATPDASGVWSLKTDPLVAGDPYSVAASSTDSAGNTGTATPTAFTFTAVANSTDTTTGGQGGGTGANGANNASRNNGFAGNRNAALLATLGAFNGQPTTTTTTPADQAVLGAQDPKSTDTSSNGDQAVKGASDTNKSNNGNIFGLAWYWWLVILAAIIALWWLIAAALRRRQAEA